MSPIKPKNFDYAAFIEELRDLYAQPCLPHKVAADQYSDSSTFQAWLKKLKLLVEQVKDIGHAPKINISRAYKPFRATAISGRPRDLAEYFQKALGETQSEIEHTLSHFDKYGPPPRAGESVAATAKAFDYAAFIDELMYLRRSFDDPPINHRHHDSTEFKRWKHLLLDLIERIESQDGYRINTGIRGRPFRIVSLGTVAPVDQLGEFNKELELTKIELDTIIQNYRKYGDPKQAANRPASKSTSNMGSALAPAPESAKKDSLMWSKEATFKWYLENTPASVIVTAIGIVFGLCLGSYKFGENQGSLRADAKQAVATTQRELAEAAQKSIKEPVFPVPNRKPDGKVSEIHFTAGPENTASAAKNKTKE